MDKREFAKAQDLVVRLMNHKRFSDPNPKDYFLFNEFMASECSFSIIYGANRIGKTETGAYRVATYLNSLDPTHPSRVFPNYEGKRILPNNKGWIITDGETIPVIVDKLLKFVPDWAIKKLNRARGAEFLETIFGNKCWIKTHDQSHRKFQSEDLDWVWWDEEPVSEDIYTQVAARLTDRAGLQFWTYTPRIGSGWIKRLLGGLQPDRKAAKKGRVSWTNAGLMQNPYIPLEMREKRREEAKIEMRTNPVMYAIVIEGEYKTFDGDEVFSDAVREVAFQKKASKIGILVKSHAQGLNEKWPSYKFIEAEGSGLEVWEEPIYGVPYIIGGDACNNKVDGDSSALQILRRDTMTLVASYHEVCDATELAVIMEAVGYWYNVAWLNPEANYPGNATISKLRELRYPKLCPRMNAKGMIKENAAAFGSLCDRWNKPVWVQTVREMFKDGVVTLHDEGLMMEMENFCRINPRNKDAPPDHYGYAAVVGHDDRVMAMIHALIGSLYMPMRVERGKLEVTRSKPENQAMNILKDLARGNKQIKKLLKERQLV